MKTTGFAFFIMKSCTWFWLRIFINLKIGNKSMKTEKEIRLLE